MDWMLCVLGRAFLPLIRVYWVCIINKESFGPLVSI